MALYKIRNLPVGAALSDVRLGHLKRLNVFAAWEHVRGAGVTIGHVDRGIVTTHPEFSGKNIATWNVLTNAAPAPADASTDGTSIESYTLWDQDAHWNHYGTMTAGLMVANGGPNGYYGVAPLADLIHVKYYNNLIYYGLGTTAKWAEAVIKAFDMGARLFCCASWWTTLDANIQAACDYVWNGGGLIIAAGGTTGTPGVPSLRYPAAYPNVVAVGGLITTDQTFGIYEHPNYYGTSNTEAMDGKSSACGDFIDLAAPAMAHALDTPGRIFHEPGGPTYATAQVAGVAALIWAANPLLTNAEVANILMSCVDKSDAGWQFYNYFTKPADPANGIPGCGIPDAERAVLKAKAKDPTNADTVFPYLRLHGQFGIQEDYYGYDYPARGAKQVFRDGKLSVYAQGQVRVELGGYCFGADGIEKPITEVEYWIDGEKLYQGLPRSKWVGTFDYNERRAHVRELKVVARTATGEESTRYYDVDLASTDGIRSTTFDVPPALETASVPVSAVDLDVGVGTSVGISVSIPTTASAAATGSAAVALSTAQALATARAVSHDTVVAVTSLLTRHPVPGISYLAGPRSAAGTIRDFGPVLVPAAAPLTANALAARIAALAGLPIAAFEIAAQPLYAGTGSGAELPTASMALTASDLRVPAAAIPGAALSLDAAVLEAVGGAHAILPRVEATLRAREAHVPTPGIDYRTYRITVYSRDRAGNRSLLTAMSVTYRWATASRGLFLN